MALSDVPKTMSEIGNASIFIAWAKHKWASRSSTSGAVVVDIYAVDVKHKEREMKDKEKFIQTY